MSTASSNISVTTDRPGADVDRTLVACGAPSNNDRPFEVRLTAVVRKGADGRFVEEYAWSDLAWGGEAQLLTPSSRDFRQTVTWPVASHRPDQPPLHARQSRRGGATAGTRS